MDAIGMETLNGELRSPLIQSGEPVATINELRATFMDAMLNEVNPIGFVETFLTRDIARRGAQIIRDEQLLDALEDQVEQALATVISPAAYEEGDTTQLLYARICAAERLEDFSRSNLRNSNAFVLRLRQLRELQRERNDGGICLQGRDVRFATEAQCIAYLARRFKLGKQQCRCGRTRRGSWIAARQCWECLDCKAQIGVRHGTVMAQSHLPLPSWFHAIAIVLYNPAVGAAELARTIEVRRQATVRSVLRKIRTALAADTASELLAGLDMIYLPDT